jgi:hypothetical protein
MTEIEQLDLTGVVPDRSIIEGDREFNPQDLHGMIDYLKTIRDQSADYVVSGKNINIRPSYGNMDKDFIIKFAGPDGNEIEFIPTNFAQDQTIGETPLPKKYYMKLAENHMDENIQHLNMWLHEGDPHRIRTVGDHYRAIMSPSYQSYDNYDVFVSVAGVVKAANTMRPLTQKPLEFYRADVTEQKLYIHLVDEGRSFDLGSPGKPDTYHPMLVVKNSEVGSGALDVDGGFFRYICENRMIHGSLWKKIHRGEKMDIGIYSFDTLKAMSEVVRKQLRDIITSSVASDSLWDKLMIGMKESKEVTLEDPVTSVHKVAGEFDLTKAEEDQVIKAMMGDTTVEAQDKNTVYALIQGLTLAEKTMSKDRGYEIAKIAMQPKQLMKVVA